MLRRHPRPLLAVVVVVALAAALRIGLAGWHSLWVDELFSLAMATGHSVEHPAAEARLDQGDYVEPSTAVTARYYQAYAEHGTPPAGLHRVVRAVRRSDTNPPLYYLLLSLWTRAGGTTDAALQLFSVLCALATVPALCSLARATGGTPAVLPACVLFSAAPMALYYSTEGRMYALVWFLATSQAALSLRLQRPGTRWAWGLLWALTGAAGLLTHHFYMFVWLAFVGWLVMRPGRLGRALLLVMVLATALAVLPWYLGVPEMLSGWRVSAGWLDGRPGWDQALLAPLEMAWTFVAARGLWGGAGWMDWGVSGTLLLLAVGAARRVSWRLVSGYRALLWLWVLAACVGPLAFDVLRGTHASLVYRYGLAGLPAAFLLVAAGLARTRCLLRWVALCVVLAAWSPGIVDSFRVPRQNHPYREVAGILRALGRPTDLILVHSMPTGALAVARYLPGNVSMASWVAQLRPRSVEDDMAPLVAGRDRVVLVHTHTRAQPAPLLHWLRTRGDLVLATRRGVAYIFTFLLRDGTTGADPPAAR